MNNFNIDENIFTQVEKGVVLTPVIRSFPIWDFSLKESEVISCGLPSTKPTPNCMLEFVRHEQLVYLRKKFSRLVEEHLDIRPPKECFNRWLFDQLAAPEVESTTTNHEPLLKNPNIARESKVLHHQLLENIPCSTQVPWGRRDREDLYRQKYIEYTRKLISWIRKWIDETNSILNTIADINSEKFTDLKSECDMLINSAGQLEEILQIFKQYSREDIRNLFDRVKKVQNTNLIKSKFETVINKIVEEIIEEVQKTIKIIEEQSSRPVPENEIVSVDLSERGEFAFIKYNQDELKITKLHYHKLRILYIIHNVMETSNKEYKTTESEKEISMNKEQRDNFHRTLYSCTRRYATLFGENEGASFHAAAPESCFEIMKKEFSVTQELFASPLNCHFGRFCSAFPDTDCWFGSFGSFFDFFPKSGSFEVNPPFTTDVMDRMAKRLDEILAQQESPLSFIVFVPEWRTPVAEYHKIMDISIFNRKTVLIKGNQHAFVVGDQHTAASRYFNLPFNTQVYFLQNESGAVTWPVTEEKLNNFAKSLNDPLQLKLVTTNKRGPYEPNKRFPPNKYQKRP